MNLQVEKKYKFTATDGRFTQTAVGTFSGFSSSGGQLVLRFHVKPFIEHQHVPASLVTEIEEVD